MVREPNKTRAYRDSTAQQLRSFWETARLGTFSAAAAHLGLVNQTVWQQVRSLERDIGEPLLVRHGRTCRLTEAGQALAKLAGPVVENLAALKQRFQELRGQREARLVVATTPRILGEDLPECVVQFRRRHPDVILTLREMSDEKVLEAIEENEAELGIGVNRSRDLSGNLWKGNPWLEFEALYEMAVFLVTRRDHPLARRQRIRIADLARFQLVNAAPDGLPDLVTMAVLEKAGLFPTQPPVIEAVFAFSIRRYTALGLGYGLVPAPLTRVPDPDLHERDMSKHFGRLPVCRLSRKGVPLSPQARAFTEIVRELLHHNPARRP
jgi:DNA-binding transcriptional LysR family regulator